SRTETSAANTRIATSLPSQIPDPNLNVDAISISSLVPAPSATQQPVTSDRKTPIVKHSGSTDWLDRQSVNLGAFPTLERIPLSPAAETSSSPTSSNTAAVQEPKRVRKRKAVVLEEPVGDEENKDMGSSIAERLKQQRRQPSRGCAAVQPPQPSLGAETSASYASGSSKPKAKRQRLGNKKPPTTVSLEDLQQARKNRERALEVLKELTITGCKKTGWPCTFNKCGKIGTRKADTVRHYKFVHLHWRDECPICHGLFSRSDGLGRHKAKYHPELTAGRGSNDEQEEQEMNEDD
ncbi:hypothetical protein EVG20_g6848, partial [Dentipellis fragilis]